MRGISRGVIVALVALSCWACSGSRAQQSEGETHWLEACSKDADCGDLDCVCGLCTTACEGDVGCAGDLAASCFATASPGLGRTCEGRNPEALPAICLPDCEDDSACHEGQICLQGACVPDVADWTDAPDAGPPEQASDAAHPLDPHAEQRAELVDNQCALLDAHPCLAVDESGSAKNIDADSCRTKLNTDAFLSIPERCWELWVEVSECLAGATYSCPCEGEACEIPAVSPGPLKAACAPLQIQYRECYFEAGVAEGLARTHSVTGSRGTCSWLETPTGPLCRLECTEPLPEPAEPGTFVEPGYRIGTECGGPPGGPLTCGCTINSRALQDNAVPAGEVIDAATCEEVAQTVADGACFEIVDCCVSWHGSPGLGREPRQLCGCTADPGAAGGHETCEQLAEAFDGTVVELCPEYQENLSSFNEF